MAETVKTVTLPGETITVETGRKQHRHDCDAMEVPLGENGLPIVRRIEIDDLGILRVLVRAHTMALYSAHSWEKVDVEPRVTLAQVG